jgi:hypothetical protein
MTLPRGSAPVVDRAPAVIRGLLQTAERLFPPLPYVRTEGHCHTLPPFPLMSPDSSPLGHCPECGRSIPDGWKLIEYERADGEPGVFAECPSCESIIRPE